MKMTIREIVIACGGRLLCGDENTVITSVSTDSRQITDGTLFVPIKGGRTDAHSFINATFAAGAAATLTQNHTEMDDVHPWIAVEDTQRALQRIAAVYRLRFLIPVVGITGSVGKTSTKEMVALALSAERNVMKTEGNFNSQIGLPLTMFRLEPEHEVAVIEMGMSEFGEMARLAQIAAPQYAVMTNIGISHIENLKTRENILTEKLHITDAFTEDSVLFLNGDDPMLHALKGRVTARTVLFGTGEDCDFRAVNIAPGENGTHFDVSIRGVMRHVSLPVFGIHNVLNALAGIAVAQELGVTPGAAIAALETYQPLAMRQQIHRFNDIIVIDDTYNASPDAMKSALSVLVELKTEGKAYAVLADMLELGDYSQRAHYEVGQAVARSGADVLVTVGERAQEIARGALSIRPDMACKVCGANDEAVAFLHTALTKGDVVLVKGSRGMHADEIVKALL